MKTKMLTVVLVLSALMILAACSNTKTNNLENNATPSGQASEKQTAEPSNESQASFLFTANEGGSINKIDPAKNEVTDTIEVDGSVHNVQLSPDGKILAATVVPKMNDEDAGHAESGENEGHAESGDGDHGMVMNGIANFYDSSSGKLIKSVEVGAHPAHVVYTNNGKYALVTNNEGNNVTVIDTSSYAVINTIDTGKGPHGFRISSDDKFAYIANMGEDTVSVIDLAKMKESKRIKVGSAPVTTGVTNNGKILTVTLNAENALAIVDLATDQVQKIEVGIGPAQVYVQADGRFAFVANQGTEDKPSKSVSKIDLIERNVVATIETGKGAHGLITSSDMTRLYVTNMFENSLSVIDNETNQVISTVKTGATPNGITITP